MLIAAEAQIGTIDPETIPDGSDKIIVLPGAEVNDRGPITLSQLQVVANYVTETFEPMTTWAEAVEALREKFLVGRQKDFTLVGKIIAEGRKANADLPLTDDQKRLVQTNLAAVMGTADHWDEGISAKVKAAAQGVKQVFAQRFLLVSNMGQLDEVMGSFETCFGRPVRQAGLGDPIGSTPPPDGTF